MQKYKVNAMTVSRKEFEQELEKVGLKFGYIPRLYEKFKQGEITVFSTLQKNTLFHVFTDDENSYPEIHEDSEKEIEQYSLEWLENLFYQSRIVGPTFYGSLMPQLEMYVRVNKAKQNDETIKQQNCTYCHPYKEHLIEGDNGFCCVTKDAELIAFNNAEKAGAVKIKINYCPICRRKLEAK